MKKLLLLSAAVALLSGGTGVAQTVSGTVDVIGHVTGTCSVQPGGGSTFGDTIDADSDEVARLYRYDAARCSGMMPPSVPI